MVALSSPAPLAGASPTPTYKYYTAQVVPSAILLSSNPTVLTVNLTNSTTSNVGFGSAEITLPNGVVFNPVFAQQTISLPHGWTATSPSSGVMLLTSSTKSVAIAPGSTLPVTFTITPASTGAYTITTEVKQSNDFSGTGNDFNLDPSSNTTFQVLASATIAWQQEPPADLAQSVANSSNTGLTTTHDMCPPVSVYVSGIDDAGIQVGVGGVSVTVVNGGTGNPGGTPPGDPGLYYNGSPIPAGGASATTHNDGVATFAASASDCSSGFAATTLGSGYTLSASAAGTSNSPQSSSSFAVVQATETCTASSCPPITVNSPANNTSGTINATFTASGQLLGSFGQGTLLCDGSVTNGNVPDDPLVSQATTTGQSYGTITMTFPKTVVNNLANNGTPLMQVCAGANNPFNVLKGTQQLTCTVDPSATPPCFKEYQGLLPDCSATDQTVIGTSPLVLCVVSRSKHAASETIVIYASDLSDPWSF